MSDLYRSDPDGYMAVMKDGDVLNWVVKVEPCEHGFIDKHPTGWPPYGSATGGWCEGAALGVDDE